MSVSPLQHPLLTARNVRHGFGVRGAELPARLVRPRQVHGANIVTAAECERSDPVAADGIISDTPDLPVAVITADCVPILMTSRSGGAVAAVHAGWRGLAAGVVAAAVSRLRDLAGTQPLLAVVGPHIGPCCYEVDTPVTDALRARFGSDLAGSTFATRPGHVRIDLGRLARVDLVAAGVEPDAIGCVPDPCTFCDAGRFHSFRREGQAAGRLVHYVAARSEQA